MTTRAFVLRTWLRCHVTLVSPSITEALMWLSSGRLRYFTPLLTKPTLIGGDQYSFPPPKQRALVVVEDAEAPAKCFCHVCAQSLKFD